MLDILIFTMFILFALQIPFIMNEKEIKISSFILFGDNSVIDNGEIK
jgi:hypothetical protein